MAYFNSLVSKVALAGSTLALGATLAASPAQAFQIGSTINITGSAKLAKGNQAAPTTDILEFLGDGTVASSTTGDFTGLIGSGVKLSNVSLSDRTVLVPSSPFGNVVGYTASIASPFLKLADGTEFIADASFSAIRNWSTTSKVLAAVPSFTGNFIKNGKTTPGLATFTYQEQKNKLGSYSLTVEAVPEPVSTLAAATALGFGAFFKKGLAKKQKKQKVNA